MPWVVKADAPLTALHPLHNTPLTFGSSPCTLTMTSRLLPKIAVTWKAGTGTSSNVPFAGGAFASRAMARRQVNTSLYLSTAPRPARR